MKAVENVQEATNVVLVMRCITSLEQSVQNVRELHGQMQAPLLV